MGGGGVLNLCLLLSFFVSLFPLDATCPAMRLQQLTQTPIHTVPHACYGKKVGNREGDSAGALFFFDNQLITCSISKKSERPLSLCSHHHLNKQVRDGHVRLIMLNVQKKCMHHVLWNHFQLCFLLGICSRSVVHRAPLC